MSGEFTHFDESGASHMVNVGGKEATHRFARASAIVHMEPATLQLIRDRSVSKGDVLEVARLAGIMAAKRTSDLIPLCHPLPLDSVQVTFTFPDERSVRIEATAQTLARTGVEMEALTAASVAALTIYDMCKSADRAMTIRQVQLEEKLGGKSGHFQRKESSSEPTTKGQ